MSITSKIQIDPVIDHAILKTLPPLTDSKKTNSQLVKSTLSNRALTTGLVALVAGALATTILAFPRKEIKAQEFIPRLITEELIPELIKDEPVYEPTFRTYAVKSVCIAAITVIVNTIPPCYEFIKGNYCTPERRENRRNKPAFDTLLTEMKTRGEITDYSADEISYQTQRGHLTYAGATKLLRTDPNNWANINTIVSNQVRFDGRPISQVHWNELRDDIDVRRDLLLRESIDRDVEYRSFCNISYPVKFLERRPSYR